MISHLCVNCGTPVGNSIVNYNGNIYCANCARGLGLFNDILAEFEELQGPLMRDPILEFANSNFECPKCRRTLTELERGKPLGCVECYNKFNEVIRKTLLKNQQTTEYKGRNPGEIKNLVVESEPEAEVKAASAPVNEPVAEETKAEKSITEMTENELKEEMSKAIAVENYKLAAEIRDELKRRQEGN